MVIPDGILKLEDMENVTLLWGNFFHSVHKDNGD